MTYDEFLMSQVLRDTSEGHKDMPYDDLFEVAIEALEQFEYSEYNQADRGLHECLVEYVKSR
jgi:hypothetical protein